MASLENSTQGLQILLVDQFVGSRHVLLLLEPGVKQLQPPRMNMLLLMLCWGWWYSEQHNLVSFLPPLGPKNLSFSPHPTQLFVLRLVKGS